MKLKNVLLTSVLVMAVVASSAFIVFAEEPVAQAPETVETDGSDLLASLFGEGGLISSLLTEITNTDMPEAADEGSAQEEGEADNVLSGLLDTLTRGAEGFSLDALDEFLGSYLGGTGDDGDSGDFDFELLFEATEKIDNAEEAYILDMNAEVLNPGDVQIVTTSSIWSPEDFSGQEEELQELIYYYQYNYVMNEDGQLLFADGAYNVVLVTLQKNEEGDYLITDAEFAEEGENHMASVEELCNKVGGSIDECMQSLDFSEWMVLYTLKNYLAEHPEVTGIEYDGEILTDEELSALQDEVLTEYSEKYYEEEEETLIEEDEQE